MLRLDDPVAAQTIVPEAMRVPSDFAQRSKKRNITGRTGDVKDVVPASSTVLPSHQVLVVFFERTLSVHIDVRISLPSLGLLH